MKQVTRISTYDAQRFLHPPAEGHEFVHLTDLAVQRVSYLVNSRKQQSDVRMDLDLRDLSDTPQTDRHHILLTAEAALLLAEDLEKVASALLETE